MQPLLYTSCCQDQPQSSQGVRIKNLEPIPRTLLWKIFLTILEGQKNNNNFPLKINNTKIENLGPGSGCRLPMSGDVLFH